MASWNIPALVNKISEDVPAIKALLTALFKWTDTDTSDVPEGAKRLQTVSGGRQIQEYSGSAWASVGKLMHDVDMLDGKHASTSQTADTIPVRDSNGSVPGNITGNAATATEASSLASGYTVPVANGGTGATTQKGARESLGANNASNIDSGILDIKYGGTGSSTKNFVDLTSNQTVGGTKTFSSSLTVTANPMLTSEKLSGISIADASRGAATNRSAFQVLDKDGKRFAGIEATAEKDGSRHLHYTMRNRADSGWISGFVLKELADGTVQHLVSTPAAAANDTQAASTAWVRAATGNTSLNAATATSAAACTGNAASATKVNKSFVIKLKSGSTEGTDLYTFNGSAAKTLDIVQGSNVTLTAAAGKLTIASTNTTYSNFVKSGSTAAAGLVPKPATTAGTTKYLREDCTWQVPPNTTYSDATTSAHGLMTAAMVTKLNGIEAGADNTPIGAILYFAAKTAPSNYLVCNGGAVSRTTYAALYEVIGTTYGKGDGSTTFNVPNLINRFPQGNATPGTVKAAGLPNITGTFEFHIWAGDTSGAFYNNGGVKRDGGTTNVSPGGTGSIKGFSAKNSNSIYGNSTTVQPPALTLLPIIRAK